MPVPAASARSAVVALLDGCDYTVRGLGSDDELIACLLIQTWTLTTGRVLRSDVPPHELSEEELIAFWSDWPGSAGPGRAEDR